jgi:lipoprotein-anchoring transpeptidase ErfK/SrfK
MGMSLRVILPASMRRRAIVGSALALVLTGCAAQRTSAGLGGRPSASTAPASRAPAATAPTTAARTTAAPPATKASAAAVPNPTPTQSHPPCAGNTAGQLVLVSLRSQYLWMCAGRHLAYSTPITSGMAGPDTATPTGSYRIQGLNRNSVLTLANGETYNVKYWIPFDAPLFGFHDSSWQTFPYGDDAYRTDGSHGCVHMPLTAIKYLYRWADIGTAAKIRA